MIHIISSGWACWDYVQDCYESIINQNVDFRATLISDGCILTSRELNKINHPKIKVVCYDTNMGAAYRRYEAIKDLDSEDIIVLLGLDDKLFKSSLRIIKNQYRKGKWMTYGNWINQYDEECSVPLHFPDSVHENRSYRQVQYRSTAPNSFKKFLFDMIPPEDFMINGVWMNTTTESELMFSCLEMCGKDRIGVIERVIYYYRENLPKGTLKRLGAQYKQNVLAIIRRRPKKELYGQRV